VSSNGAHVIHLKPVAPIVEEGTVALCERLLEMAQKGELRGMAVAMLLTDCGVATAVTDACEIRNIVYATRLLSVRVDRMIVDD
jgi:hypothetical protein